MGQENNIDQERALRVSAPLSITLVGAGILATAGFIYDGVISNPSAQLAQLTAQVAAMHTQIEIIKVRLEDCD